MRYILAVILCLFIISCNASETLTFNEFLDNYSKEVIKLNPSTGSYLGLDSSGNYTYDKSKLTDNSEAAYQHELKLVEQYFFNVRKFDQLSKDNSLESSVFKHYLQNIITADEYRYHYYMLNYMYGFHSNLIGLFTENHSIINEQDIKDYISRMEQIDTYFDNFFPQLKKREKLKIFPSKIVLNNLQNIIDNFLEKRPVEMIFYTYFENKLNELEDFDAVRKQIYLARCLDAVNSNIVPNYKKISNHIDNLINKTNNDIGVWKLPDGDKFYKFCLQKHTTTDLTPEEIHQIGLTEVARIQAESLQRFKKLGFTEGTFSEIEEQYWNYMQGDKFKYSQNDKGRQQALNDYLQIIEETDERLTNVFKKIPSIPVTVRAVPPHKEQFAGQYYDRAPIDGSRPAIFYTNLSWLPNKKGMQTLLHHETIPGHHLQIAYAQELADIPIYRNFTFFTAFIEGWALYAEKLAFEQGWYDDIYSELGYLNSELFRAVRLVVDTGIHYKKWSRTQAAEYMKENLGWASYGEIDRYSVWPGQACAYKIGELKILELREKAKKELGDDFDLKEFHDVILQNGAVPLDLLEEVVNKWLIK